MKLTLGKNQVVPLGWFNGNRLVFSVDGEALLDADHAVPDEANLIVLHIKPTNEGVSMKPVFVSGKTTISLKGNWQIRLGDDPS